MQKSKQTTETAVTYEPMLATALCFTGYLDDNQKPINVGCKVKIACNPYHGEYEVKFGEYKLRNWTKHDRQVIHCGLYLCNEENIISLAYAMTKPTGYFDSTHSIEVV